MSTTEADFSHQRVPLKRRHWPQLSLLSLLLAVALICVSTSHFRLDRENEQLRERNHEVMKQAGLLVVHDPNKVYLRQVATLDAMTWRYQIYLPPSKKYTLFSVASGSRAFSGAGIVHDNEQMTITAGLRRDANGEWRLKVLFPTWALSMGADTEVAEKLQNVDFPVISEKQKELDPDKPFELAQFANGDFHLWVEPGVNPMPSQLLANRPNGPK